MTSHLIEDGRLAGAPLAVQHQGVVLVLADQVVPDPGKDVFSSIEHSLGGHRIPGDVGVDQRSRHADHSTQANKTANLTFIIA